MRLPSQPGVGGSQGGEAGLGASLFLKHQNCYCGAELACVMAVASLSEKPPIVVCLLLVREGAGVTRHREGVGEECGFVFIGLFLVASPRGGVREKALVSCALLQCSTDPCLRPRGRRKFLELSQLPAPGDVIWGQVN